ncbi:MAG: hypothetical protein O2871_00100 [bacterium]|nr:hypothetical protein [bacterium]
MIRKFIVFINIVILSSILFFSSTKTSYAISEISIDLINQERINRGLNKIEIDENLCTLAQILANDRELAYPE